jgi:hypothetical protein
MDMNRLGREGRALPQLSRELMHIIDTAQAVLKSQAAKAADERLAEIPHYSDWHDELIACYLLGFVNGMCHHARADLAGAGHDEALAERGFLECASQALAGVLGQERAARCQAALPHWRQQPAQGDFAMMERTGSDDGYAVAAVRVLPTGGGLLRFLRQNLASPGALKAPSAAAGGVPESAP